MCWWMCWWMCGCRTRGRGGSGGQPAPVPVDRGPAVLVYEAVVDGEGGCGPFPGGGDDLGPSVDGVASAPDPGDARPTRGVDRHPAVVPTAHPRLVSRVSLGTSVGRTNTASLGTTRPSVELDAGQVVILDDESGDGLLDYPDAEATSAHGPRGEGGPVGEEDHVIGPLPDEEGVGDDSGSAEDAERLVADFVAMAVRAVEEVSAPALAEPRDVGDVVVEPGGDEDATGCTTLPLACSPRSPAL